MKKLLNRKGQLGGSPLAPVLGLIMGVVFLVFFVFAVLFGIATLNPSSFFTANSLEANSTSNIQKNLTSGIDTYTGYLPTMFKVLAVVTILGFIGMLIAAVIAFVVMKRADYI